MTSKTNNQIPATWTATEGLYEHASKTAVVTQQGKRWIGIIDGSTLCGESGGTRFFGTAEAAIAAVDQVLPQDAQDAAAAIIAERLEAEPVAEEVAAEEPKPRRTRKLALVEPLAEEGGEAPAAAEKPAKVKKERAPKVEGPRDFSGILAEDEELDQVLATAGWSREGIEGGKLAGPQGELEVTGERGSWVAKSATGEYLTGPSGGKRLFKRASAALSALLKAA